MTAVKIKKKKIQKSVIKRKIKFEHQNIEINHKQFIRNNKSILKAQQKFKSERHNFFTEEINKIALSSNEYQRMQ